MYSGESRESQPPYRSSCVCVDASLFYAKTPFLGWLLSTYRLWEINPDSFTDDLWVRTACADSSGRATYMVQ